MGIAPLFLISTKLCGENFIFCYISYLSNYSQRKTSYMRQTILLLWYSYQLIFPNFFNRVSLENKDHCQEVYLFLLCFGVTTKHIELEVSVCWSEGRSSKKIKQDVGDIVIFVDWGHWGSRAQGGQLICFKGEEFKKWKAELSYATLRNFYLRCLKSDFDGVKSKFGLLIE